MSLAMVRGRLAELRASGVIVTCTLTRYESEQTIEAWQCRVSGFVPSPARKAKGPQRRGPFGTGQAVQEGLFPRGVGLSASTHRPTRCAPQPASGLSAKLLDARRHRSR